MSVLRGHLLSSNQGFQSENVTLYEIPESTSEKSRLIASTSSDAAGLFAFEDVNLSSKRTYYISANDGTNHLLGLLRDSDTKNLIVNDLTTAAGAYTFNRFIDGEALSGSAASVRSGWMTYQNLVNPDGSIADVASNNAATAERLNLLANINAAAIRDLTFRKALF